MSRWRTPNVLRAVWTGAAFMKFGRAPTTWVASKAVSGALRHSTSICMVLEEPVVGVLDAFAESHAMPPPERVKARHIQQLPRRAVGLRGIKDNLRVRMDDTPHHVGELRDRHVFARADVDVHCLVVVV